MTSSDSAVEANKKPTKQASEQKMKKRKKKKRKRSEQYISIIDTLGEFWNWYELKKDEVKDDDDVAKFLDMLVGFKLGYDFCYYEHDLI